MCCWHSFKGRREGRKEKGKGRRKEGGKGERKEGKKKGRRGKKKEEGKKKEGRREAFSTRCSRLGGWGRCIHTYMI